jgi:hypothetical protein
LIFGCLQSLTYACQGRGSRQLFSLRREAVCSSEVTCANAALNVACQLPQRDVLAIGQVKLSL